MKNKKKVIPQMLAVAIETMLDTLPMEMFIDKKSAYATLDHFRNRSDNYEIAALSDMLVDIQGCLEPEIPPGRDVILLAGRFDFNMRERLGAWQNSLWK